MMEGVSLIQVIIAMIGTLTTGGIISSIVSFRYMKSKEKAKAKQEIEQADGLGLNNAANIVSLYKNTLEDLNNLKEKTAKEYKERIDKLESILDEYQGKLSIYETKIREQQNLIRTMTRSQLAMQVEIETLSGHHKNSKKNE